MSKYVHERYRFCKITLISTKIIKGKFDFCQFALNYLTRFISNVMCKKKKKQETIEMICIMHLLVLRVIHVLFSRDTISCSLLMPQSSRQIAL